MIKKIKDRIASRAPGWHKWLYLKADYFKVDNVDIDEYKIYFSRKIKSGFFRTHLVCMCLGVYTYVHIRI